MSSPIRGRSMERKSHDHSRWAGMEKHAVPGLPLFVPDVLAEEELEALLLRFRIDEIGYKLAHNNIDVELRARSPSPPPKYGANGKRTNTREQRAKEKLLAERQRLVDRANSLYPNYRPPADYYPLFSSYTRKIFIPVQEYPDYKFIGLILGPRGSTHKEMEKETGAKIAIRGRGSRPEGRRSFPSGDSGSDENDELHVLLTASSQEALDHAESLVSRLLIPVEEGLNLVKAKQLRKLAELTGTLKDPNYGLTRSTKTEVVEHLSRPSCLPPPQHPHQFVTQAYYELMSSLGEDVSHMKVQAESVQLLHLQNEENYHSFLFSVGIETFSPVDKLSNAPYASCHQLDLNSQLQPWDL